MSQALVPPVAEMSQPPPAAPRVDLEELDRLGVTVVRQLLPPALTAALRAATDQLLQESEQEAASVSAEGSEAAPPRTVHDLRDMRLYSGSQRSVLAAAVAEPRSLGVAQLTHRCEEGELQLIEQVLIKTDPSTPVQGHGPTNWHLDWVFLREHADAVPRETYFHMVTYLSDVRPGQAAFTIVPGSHHKTYAAAAKLSSIEGLEQWGGELGQAGGPFAALKDDPVGVAGIDTSAAIEITASEGDCVIFNPMCLHSGSTNSTVDPRYVYFQSYFSRSATYLAAGLKGGYQQGEAKAQAAEALAQALPAELRHLLDSRRAPPPQQQPRL